jgi:hypothetical protein
MRVCPCRCDPRPLDPSCRYVQKLFVESVRALLFLILRDLLVATPESSPLRVLREATCVFLYSYPTLLNGLVPLLETLSNRFKARRIITLTYHLDERTATLVDSNEEFDLRCYSCVQRRA